MHFPQYRRMGWLTASQTTGTATCPFLQLCLLKFYVLFQPQFRDLVLCIHLVYSIYLRDRLLGIHVRIRISIPAKSLTVTYIRHSFKENWLNMWNSQVSLITTVQSDVTEYSYYSRLAQLYGVDMPLFITRSVPCSPGASMVTSIFSTRGYSERWRACSLENRVLRQLRTSDAERRSAAALDTKPAWHTLALRVLY